MLKTLVVFEEIPETARFIILDTDQETFNKLRRFHGVHVNEMKSDAKLQDEIIKFFYHPEDGTLLHPTFEGPLSGKFDQIIQTGAIL